MLCPKSKPLRDPAYCRSAQNRMCDVPSCYRMGIEGGVVLAHINISGNFGLSMKAGDDESLFLCSDHHRELDDPNASAPADRALWIVRNIVIPLRRENYRGWKAGLSA